MGLRRTGPCLLRGLDPLVLLLLGAACQDSPGHGADSAPPPYGDGAPSRLDARVHDAGPGPEVDAAAGVDASGLVAEGRFVDGAGGSDSNPGTEDLPWLTLDKAVRTVVAGQTIYVRGGTYPGKKNGWVFQSSGTATLPITLTNYPGEQVILQLTNATQVDYNLFGCSINPHDPPTWATPKADHIRIVGTGVTPRALPVGVESSRGIVMLGLEGAQSAGIVVSDCDHWEVAGVDFVDLSSGIFTFKNNWSGTEEHSTDGWHVHHNRVYRFYRESGMQFNGDENLVEDNEILKVTDRVDTPYGCQMIDVLGDHNVIRRNVLSRSGSAAECAGVLFEWDLADLNTLEQNLIFDVNAGVHLQGGDHNTIRNNVIYRAGTPDPYLAGIGIFSYDDRTSWPCNEATGPLAILPPEDPTHPDYANYYEPRNCHSFGNQIYGNTIAGFVEGIRLYELAPEGTVIRNNAFAAWTRGSICLYLPSNGTCRPLPAQVTASHNADTAPFGFVDFAGNDFHLGAGSPLIDSGYDLGASNPVDFEGTPRPQGGGHDIGAFEWRP